PWLLRLHRVDARLDRWVGQVHAVLWARQGPAQERRARKAEAPGNIDGPRDPDSRPADYLDGRVRGLQVERRDLHGHSVVPEVDAERLAHAAGPGAKQAGCLDPATRSHCLETG